MISQTASLVGLLLAAAWPQATWAQDKGFKIVREDGKPIYAQYEDGRVAVLKSAVMRMNEVKIPVKVVENLCTSRDKRTVRWGKLKRA